MSKEIITPVLPYDLTPQILRKTKSDGSHIFIDRLNTPVDTYGQGLADYLASIASDFEDVLNLLDDDAFGRYSFLFKLLIKGIKNDSDAVFHLQKNDILTIRKIRGGRFEDAIVDVSVKTY